MPPGLYARIKVKYTVLTIDQMRQFDLLLQLPPLHPLLCLKNRQGTNLAVESVLYQTRQAIQLLEMKHKYTFGIFINGLVILL